MAKNQTTQPGPKVKTGFLKLTGKEPGPVSLILAGVHGDEKCGVAAFKNLLPNLKIEKGTVYLGYGNPRAIAAEKRGTEADLNRMFKPDADLTAAQKSSYEYRRAQFLKKYFEKSDALLDLHASRNPASVPFAICEASAKGIVEYLPVALVTSGFDDVEPGGTDYYMNKIGKTGVCVECGYREKPAATKAAEEAILAFLKARGHLPGRPKPRRQSYLHMYYLHITKTNFTLAKKFKDFEPVKKDQLIGQDGDQEFRADRDAVILFPHDATGPNHEAFLLGEPRPSLGLPRNIP